MEQITFLPKFKILKAVVEMINKPFANSINFPITEKTFPNILKKSIVVPIKAMLMMLATVSLFQLWVFFKIYELIIFIRLLEFLCKFGLLDPAQHSLRSCRSNQTTTLTFVESIYACLDNDACGRLILLSFSGLRYAFLSFFIPTSFGSSVTKKKNRCSQKRFSEHECTITYLLFSKSLLKEGWN